MNLQEFAALKVGDKITNPMNGSDGTVAEVTSTGVGVVWGARHDAEKKFTYPALSTAWTHWTKL